MNWLLYGANGYTGELVAREAAKRGMRPILAGRDRTRIEPLARELGLDHRVFDLKHAEGVATGLQGIQLVLHCAGPFSATSAPMIQGCLNAGAHYLDISGEISVFEHAHSLNAAAQAAGVVLCPGVGFDVIPTDCLALALKQALPDASHLFLGFDTRSGLSPGTAKTAIEGIGLGGQVRINGQITTVPHAWKVRRINYGDGEKKAMTIPWGDVSTAFHSTGIPNIEVYLPAPGLMVLASRIGNHFGWLMRRPAVIQRLQKFVEGRVKGPDAQHREYLPTYVWGEVRNAAGQRKTARVKTANGYDVTVHGSLAVVTHLLQAAPEGGGCYTPSRLMGADLIGQLPGSGPVQIT
jgi:short subunit dehydrogenase-like uncharacterized protein